MGKMKREYAEKVVDVHVREALLAGVDLNHFCVNCFAGSNNEAEGKHQCTGNATFEFDEAAGKPIAQACECACPAAKAHREKTKKERIMNIEKTFAYIKPDAVEAGHVGHALSRIEREGFVVERMALHRFTEEQVDALYAEHVDKHFYADLKAFTLSGPVVLLVLAREDAVAHWRKVLGATDPRKAAEEFARSTNAGARSVLDHLIAVENGDAPLRALYGNKDGVIFRNVAHGSATLEDAAREIGLLEKWDATDRKLEHGVVRMVLRRMREAIGLPDAAVEDIAEAIRDLRQESSAEMRRDPSEVKARYCAFDTIREAIGLPYASAKDIAAEVERLVRVVAMQPDTVLGENERLHKDLDEVRAGYRALDKNWAAVHEGAMKSIREAVGLPEGTVPEIVQAITIAKLTLTKVAYEIVSQMPESEPKACPSHLHPDTARALAEELQRGRAKYPGRGFLIAALAAELGELAEAQGDAPDVREKYMREEALQVASIAVRIYEDGEPTVYTKDGLAYLIELVGRVAKFSIQRLPVKLRSSLGMLAAVASRLRGSEDETFDSVPETKKEPR